MEEFTGKSLLFIGGGEESCPGIRRAREVGLKTAVLDRSSLAPGLILAERGLVGSIFDVDNAVKIASELHHDWPIDGVLSVGTDVPLTVAAVASSLGLASIGERSAGYASNKLLMKQRFAACNVPTAPGFAVSTASDVREAIEVLGGAVVVKPADSRGARGVSFVQAGDDHEARFVDAFAESPTGVVVVEKFLDGPQFSTESVVHDGRIATVGVSTRNYGRLPQTYPFPVEDGGDLPAKLPADAVEEIDAVLLAAASALGIASGTVKGDLVQHDGRIFIIELAARLSGGYFATHEIPLSTGIDYLATAFRLALGLQPDWDALIPSRNVPVAQRYFFPKPGRVESISVPDWVKEHPNVELFVMRLRVGDVVPEIRNHPARAGLVISTGQTPEGAIGLAESVVQAVDIRTTSR